MLIFFHKEILPGFKPGPITAESRSLPVGRVTPHSNFNWRRVVDMLGLVHTRFVTVVLCSHVSLLLQNPTHCGSTQSHIRNPKSWFQGYDLRPDLRALFGSPSDQEKQCSVCYREILGNLVIIVMIFIQKMLISSSEFRPYRINTTCSHFFHFHENFHCRKTRVTRITGQESGQTTQDE